MSLRIETVKYWAGQKLLHSPFHLYYLRLTGKIPRPHTYEEWLISEGPRLNSAALPKGYRMVLPPDSRLAPDAQFWFSEAIADTGADLVYSDEDVLDVEGRRRDPVFKPAWSPELFRRCNFLGGAYAIRDGVPVGSGKSVHVPRVLVHRSKAARYDARDIAPPQQAAPLVSVIVCSRTPALASSCLAALRATTAWPNYEIVLIDHCAGMQAIAERYGANRVLFEDEFNFAQMCNVGIQASSGELVLFLNDDAAPIDPQWMSYMAAQAARREIGAVGAYLTFPDGSIQHAGVYIGTPNGAGHPGRLTRGRALWPWLGMTREQSAVTGACLMMRRDVFHQVDGFDENFPNNYNDVDLCLKIGKAGYKVLLEASARVEHRESATRKTGIRYGERRRFMERWSDVLDRRDPYFNPNLTDNEDLLPDPDAFARVGRWR